ncbi:MULTISPECIES: hypothetical protein [Acidobacteriaceae]|uniref:hypothetical protein n=1 Tax=Acidobacteriaceae TaxID=204434 RepID=UPI0020B11010|nr:MULTISPECIES: hypothetical protein [Acidobacteriaceae]MDW5267634.1 hypothetical protein [Edaphobacter sp.]
MMPFHLQTSKLGAVCIAAAFLAALACTPATLHAQELTAGTSSSLIAASDSVADSLPDAPLPASDLQTGQATAPAAATAQATAPAAATAPTDPQQTKRILGIMPNFRSVSADTKLPPQSAKDKFIAAGRDTFDYSSFFIAGLQAGFAMNGDSYPEFHQGVKGYARYYWHTLADTADENFMVGGIGPVLFHQDNRFYTLGHGSIGHRALYAASRVLITRKDDGDNTFNFSEVIGSGAASGVSSLYYPTKYRTWTKVGQKWLTSDLIDGVSFTFKEFWPDINHKLFHTQ